MRVIVRRTGSSGTAAEEYVCQEHDLVARLKARIQAKYGVQALGRFALLSGGFRLPDSKRLHDCGVRDGSSVDI